MSDSYHAQFSSSEVLAKSTPHRACSIQCLILVVPRFEVCFLFFLITFLSFVSLLLNMFFSCSTQFFSCEVLEQPYSCRAYSSRCAWFSLSLVLSLSGF